MPANIEKLKQITQIVYILHAVSIILGFFTGGSVLSAFLFGWPSIAAVVINYVFASDAQGSYLKSHFSWQIRTFWYGFFWTLAVSFVGLVFTVVLFGFAIWWIGFFCLSLWVTYRIVYGWYHLSRGDAIPNWN
ncbi:MAG TPA: hypothetical protein DCW60_00180 [Sutterella sp.]|nr:hypothetical protein [Sutterella sp.]